jgi:hypothetical protein
MSAKRTNKSKGPFARVAEIVKKRINAASNRTYVRKHSDTMAFFYKSEVSEIDTMIQAADSLARQHES